GGGPHRCAWLGGNRLLWGQGGRGVVRIGGHRSSSSLGGYLSATPFDHRPRDFAFREPHVSGPRAEVHLIGGTGARTSKGPEKQRSWGPSRSRGASAQLDLLRARGLLGEHVRGLRYGADLALRLRLDLDRELARLTDLRHLDGL